jgi:hypothetical protein
MPQLEVTCLAFGEQLKVELKTKVELVELGKDLSLVLYHFYQINLVCFELEGLATQIIFLVLHELLV